MQEKIKAKKSLGQHFLNSPQIINDIVLAGNVIKEDTILEIGPGGGTLTSTLLQTRAHIISIEKDDRLIPELQKKFVKEIASKQFDLIHGDILDLEIPNISLGGYKVVANIPYYITGQIIRMFLESNRQPKLMTLLIQKEVADRIIARDGKESLLSLSVKVYGEPKLIRNVGRGAFSPPPNVDSAVLNIENISKERISNLDEKFFFQIIHLGFAHKRKQLLPNLSEHYNKEILLKVFEKCGMDLKVRAEDIHLQSWLNLCKELKTVIQ